MIGIAPKKIPAVGGVGCSQARKVNRTAAAESSRAVEGVLQSSREDTPDCARLLCARSGSERTTVEVSGGAELRVREKPQTLPCSQWEMEGLAGLWRP